LGLLLVEVIVNHALGLLGFACCTNIFHETPFDVVVKEPFILRVLVLSLKLRSELHPKIQLLLY
jgi:hypothetical protein